MNKEELIKFANDELIFQGNMNVVDEVFSNSYVVHSGGRDLKGGMEGHSCYSF